MNVKFLKTGRYSIHPVWGPIVECIEGEVDSIDDSVGKSLVDAGYAIEIEPVTGEDSGFDEDVLGLGQEGSLEGSKEGDQEQVERSGEEVTKNTLEVDSDEEPIAWTRATAREELDTLISFETDDSEVKQKIQDWGIANAGIKVGKNKGVETMISEICDTFE